MTLRYDPLKSYQNRDPFRGEESCRECNPPQLQEPYKKDRLHFSSSRGDISLYRVVLEDEDLGSRAVEVLAPKGKLEGYVIYYPEETEKCECGNNKVEVYQGKDIKIYNK